MKSNDDNKPPFSQRLALSINEFCALTSLSRSHTYLEIQAGRLAVCKRGKRSLITMEEARRYISGGPAADAA